MIVSIVASFKPLCACKTPPHIVCIQYLSSLVCSPAQQLCLNPNLSPTSDSSRVVADRLCVDCEI